MPYLRCPKKDCSKMVHISVMLGWYETTGKQMQENSDGSFSFPCPDCWKKMDEKEKAEWLSEPTQSS